METPITATDAFDPDDLEPISFELANGSKVEVRAGEFSAKLDISEIRRGVKAPRFYAIRIYCMEDSRMRMIQELVDGAECTRASVPEVFEALREHITSRDYLEHEEPEDFVEWLIDEAGKHWGTPEDAKDHIDRLPRIEDPEFYDRENDIRREES